jgi:hypothetical protein
VVHNLPSIQQCLADIFAHPTGVLPQGQYMIMQTPIRQTSPPLRSKRSGRIPGRSLFLGHPIGED